MVNGYTVTWQLIDKSATILFYFFFSRNLWNILQRNLWCKGQESRVWPAALQNPRHWNGTCRAERILILNRTAGTLPPLHGIYPPHPQVCFLMPSSSPRCAQFPRAQDKVHFYIKLKELRDQMKGLTPNGEVLETRYSFDLQLAKGTLHHAFGHWKNCSVLQLSLFLSEKLLTHDWRVCAAEDAKRMAIKEEQVDPEYESCSGLHDGVRQSSWDRGEEDHRPTTVALRYCVAVGKDWYFELVCSTDFKSRQSL